MSRSLRVLVLASLACACSRPAPDTQAATSAAATSSAGPTTVEKFDPKADPVKDLAAAVVLAKSSGRRIILDVGGEWCSWCHILDRFIRDHADVSTAIARDFVWLKINFSPDNENKAFLSTYPAIPGYPHLYMLSQDGDLLHSQDTALLELGPSYDLAKVQAFLAQWARR